MDTSKIPVGTNPPWEINVIVEIPLGSDPVKYEVDKASGALFVDRFLHTAMFYPCNYGFIPNTLADDGDPVDVLVVAPVPVISGAIVRSRPIGLLVMEDEAGADEKVIAVPVDALHPYHREVSSYRQLPKILIDQIAHFFRHYKDLEQGKWVDIKRWGEADEAFDLIRRAAATYREDDLDE
jgi:inorganic pyrophosphatase